MSQGSDFEDEFALLGSKKRSRQIASDSEDDFDPAYDGNSKKKKSDVKRTRRGTAMADDDDGGDLTALTGAIENYLTEEDHQRMATMNELEREMFLAEKDDERQRELQRRAVLAAAGHDDKKPAARRSGREVREETAKKSAMEELKAARKRKSQSGKSRAKAALLEQEEEEEEGEETEEEEDEQQQQQQQQQQPPRGDGDYSLGEIEEDRDDEYGALGSLRWAPRDATEEDEEAGIEAGHDEIKSIQVTRQKLEEWISKPHFRTTLPGCMVRLVAGIRKDADGRVMYEADGRTPVKRYMVAQVVGIEEIAQPGLVKYMDDRNSPPWKNPYPFGPRGEKINLWLVVSRGKSERKWPLVQVSNTECTVSEYESWHRSCIEGQRAQITRGEVASVLEKIKAADSFVFTAEEVARMLEEKRAKGQGGRNIALERARLERERDAAIELGDEEKLAQVMAEFELLEATAAAAMAAKQRGVGASMAMLNKKNAERNFQTAFRSAKEAGASGAGSNATTLDPFSRRVTRTKNYWNTARAGDRGDGNNEMQEDVSKNRESESKEMELLTGEKATSTHLTTVIDLSGLDLSLLDAAPKMDPIARKLLGSSGGNNNRILANSNGEGSDRSITLSEYRHMSGMRA